MSFNGTLLDDAVLSSEAVSQAGEGGRYSNFTLSLVDDQGHVGHILPPLESGSWILDDPGDTVATVYQLDERAFTVKFQFRQALGSPSDYVVRVLGYKDDTRTPTIGDNIDMLGYARIRDENTAPQFPDTETGVRSVAENTPAGEHVGAPVVATDADNDVLTYTLSGADMASFAIDSATGQLMTVDALDFETKASYSVSVAASDGEDESSVTVTNVGLDNAYDADDSGAIDKSEVIQAINDYLDGGDGAPSKADVIKLINFYLDG